MLRTADHDGVRRELRRRGYGIFRTRDQYHGERTAHHHDFYEVFLFWSGSLHYRVEDRSYHMTNGDILLIPPGNSHQPHPEAEPGSCERVVLWIDRDCFRRFPGLGFDPIECFEGGVCCLRFDDEVTMRIGELLERCMRERSSEELGSAVMADAAMLQAAILINRLRLKSVRSERRSRTGSLVSSVLEYINSHFSEELTLDNLAGRFFISKYHLSREFGRIVGIPLHRYITQKRLVVAKQMLSEGLPSSAVYQHCGFGDYSNFYRAFRGEYGISPKRYVSSLRTETDTAPGEAPVFTQDAGDGILKKRQRNKKGNAL